MPVVLISQGYAHHVHSGKTLVLAVIGNLKTGWAHKVGTIR
jgi:hypothetical protein